MNVFWATVLNFKPLTPFKINMFFICGATLVTVGQWLSLVSTAEPEPSDHVAKEKQEMTLHRDKCHRDNSLARTALPHIKNLL